MEFPFCRTAGGLGSSQYTSTAKCGNMEASHSVQSVGVPGIDAAPRAAVAFTQGGPTVPNCQTVKA